MVEKFKTIFLYLFSLCALFCFNEKNIKNQHKTKSQTIIREDCDMFMCYNFYDIFITEFGDEFLRHAYSSQKNVAGFLIFEYDVYSKTTSIKISDYYKLPFNSSRLQKCYAEYPYHLFYKRNDRDWTIIHYPMYGLIKLKWNGIIRNKVIDDTSFENFKIFVHREILSGIKELLGEEHEYYKYLLEKYAPLKPYENWSLVGSDYLKQDK